MIFAYPSNPGSTVLKKTSLSIPAGERCFIVGRSGSGKSTLANLLLKLYEPLSGDILIDGESLQTLDTEWVRRNITLVQQTSVLFDDTFYVNVALGGASQGQPGQDQDPTFKNVPPQEQQQRITEITSCLDFALLGETIASLPRGLATRVGPHTGHDLSGGQKQRVALARARLRDTPVLVLDEATSGLDPASRNRVREAIRRWRRGRTTVIITHDVAQIRADERVYVLEDGRVVQHGLRRDLARDKNGMFVQLAALPPTSGNRKMKKMGEEGAPYAPWLFDGEDCDRHVHVLSHVMANNFLNFSRPLSIKSQQKMQLSRESSTDGSQTPDSDQSLGTVSDVEDRRLHMKRQTFYQNPPQAIPEAQNATTKTNSFGLT